MKKTQKRILGFFGLMTVAVMTVVAVAIPNPGVSAVSGVTDTVVIRVVGDSPNVNIGGIEPGTVTINPQKDLTIAYENVGKVRIEQYIDKVKNERDKLLLIPKAAEYGIESMEDISALTDFFTTASSFEEAIQKNPYHVYYDMLKYNWNKTDKLVCSTKLSLISSSLIEKYKPYSLPFEVTQ